MDKQSRRQTLREGILKQAKEHYDPDKINLNTIFYGNSLRLKRQGLTMIGSLYNQYKFKAEQNWTKRTKTLIQLDKSMNYPYYIDKKAIILFEEEASVWLKMYGDADTWLNIFAEN